MSSGLKQWLAVGVAALLTVAGTAEAQQAQGLDETCVIAVLNRTTPVNPDGTWTLPNIPAGFGPVRARATCVRNGQTIFGQSALFTIQANHMNAIPPITLGSVTPVPSALTIAATSSTLTVAGSTTQLTVTAAYAASAGLNVTQASTGTQYIVSNPAIATVSANGLVTAVASGAAVIQAANEGTTGLIMIQVVLSGVDTDGDGIPDDAEIRMGLNPRDPTDALLDPDHDGLTNLREYQLGTDINKADTDGDGLTDGQEVLIYHTNPLLADTDGDGIPDGLEVTQGTNPLDPKSFNLGGALISIEVKPAKFVLSLNSLSLIASQQLSVIGKLSDGKSTIDLTSTVRGTGYSSSDLTICNFGSPDGNVFGAKAGSCTITVTTNGFTATSTGVVTQVFNPISLSFLTIPGFANGVDVNGNYAYVAAGASGLQIVNISNHNQPVIAGSIAIPGNANAVKLLGNLAYVAAGTAGLQVVNVTNPAAPVVLGALNTNGMARAVVVKGSTAYIANGTNLVIANVTNPAAMTTIATLPLTGNIQGIDVDAQRKLAVVAAGSTGIHVVDIATPAAPVKRGTVSTGDARAVAIGGNFAYVADYTKSTTSVDITSPAAPVVLSNITDSNLGGFLQDIVLSGNFALAADVKFVNGVPITDISIPSALQARAILNFPQRDDNGMGIVADATYVYLVAEHSNLNKFGSTGDSRLYIGQYIALQDLFGIPPTVSITSPAPGISVIEGLSLPITVDAKDDVAVAAVNFLLNGQTVFTSTRSPYQFNLSVPKGVSSITLGATAIDLGGNTATATNVVVQVMPDPGTRVTGITLDAQSNPIVGATVTCLGVTGTSGALGAFSIAAVPTVQGNIQCRATATSAGQPITGFSAALAPVSGGTTNVGSFTLTLGATVLILTDADGPGPTALSAALTAAHNTVTLRPAPEYSWDATNPGLTNYNCVIHLDGATYNNPLPAAAQTALEAFVQSGKGGYIGTQWDGYERSQGSQILMPNLVMQLWNTGNDQDCGNCSITYNAVTAQQNHPVLVGVPASFTFQADGHSAATAIVYATQPSTALMTIPQGGPAVLVRDFGTGRVVNFSAAPGYTGQQTLLDANIQKLFVNAVAWACQGR